MRDPSLLHNECLRHDASAHRIEYLVKLGEDVNQCNAKGMTPLHCACYIDFPSIAIIECLVQCGADVNGLDPSGNTPLHYVCEHRISQKAIVKLLVQNGACVNIRDKGGNSPLHCVCLGSRDASILKFLIRAGANVNQTDNAGKPPIYYASKCYHKVARDLILLLLQHEAYVSKNLFHYPNFTKTYTNWMREKIVAGIFALRGRIPDDLIVEVMISMEL